MDVVVGFEFVEVDDGAVVHGNEFVGAFIVFGGDLFGVGDVVDGVGGSHVLADIVVGFGGTGDVVEGDAGGDDVDKGKPFVGNGGLNDGDELFFIA